MNGNNEIGEDEMLAAMSKAGLEPNKEQIRKLIKKIDIDGDGQVSL